MFPVAEDKGSSMKKIRRLGIKISDASRTYRSTSVTSRSCSAPTVQGKQPGSILFGSCAIAAFAASPKRPRTAIMGSECSGRAHRIMKASRSRSRETGTLSYFLKVDFAEGRVNPYPEERLLILENKKVVLERALGSSESRVGTDGNSPLGPAIQLQDPDKLALNQYLMQAAAYAPAQELNQLLPACTCNIGICRQRSHRKMAAPSNYRDALSRAIEPI